MQNTSWLLQNSESDSYDKNDMEEKVNEQVRLEKVIEKKLKTTSYPEQIQILTLLLNNWS